MTTKSRLALRRTAFWALCFSIPLAIFCYYQLEYGRDEPLANLGTVAPFYFAKDAPASRDETGFSNHELRATINLIALVPGGELSPEEASKLADIATWTREHLKGNANTGRAYGLHLIRTAAGATPPSGDWQAYTADNPSELRAFLPAGHTLDKAQVVVVDHNSDIRAIYELAETPLIPLGRTLAKLNFNHYLNSYLSKRTFFGPKRV